MRILRTIMIFAILMIGILLLTGCRYRLHNEGVTPYSDVNPPPETTYTPPEAPPEAPSPPTAEQPQVPPTTPPPETPPEPPAQTPGITPPYEQVPPTYIQAEEDNLSPQMVEVTYEDARQYASIEGDTGDTITGTEMPQDSSSNIITISAPGETDDDDQAVLGDDGGVVGIVEDYTTLLRQGVNTLFPCQLLYIYCETPQDLIAAGRGSTMYQLMVSAGGVNVSTRLTPDRLAVDEDWVVRRNPDVIVKFVDNTVLGSNISTSGPAVELRGAIISREGWGQVEAVRNNRIILFSQQMLDTDESRLAVKLLVSRMMYPELFTNMDVDGVVHELIRDMSGTHIFM